MRAALKISHESAPDSLEAGSNSGERRFFAECNVGKGQSDDFAENTLSIIPSAVHIYYYYCCCYCYCKCLSTYSFA